MEEKLFRIKMPDIDMKHIDELYYKKDGDAVLANGKISISPSAKISTDTYFNCFSYKKYCNFTIIKNVTTALELKGKGKIVIKRCFIIEKEKQILQKNAAKYKKKNRFKETEAGIYGKPNRNLEIFDNGDLITQVTDSEIKKYQVKEEILNTITFDLAKRDVVSIDVDICNYREEGFLFSEIIADTQCEFYGGKYIARQLPVNKIKLGIVICTYKRESYVLKNLQRLKEHINNNGNLADQIEIFLIDNGKTISQKQMPIGRVFPNKNLGGSGGFTRGIEEVCKRKDVFSHFLLMDDDIEFDCEVFEKLLSILQYASDDSLSVGGSMLILDKPYIQYENGANWNGMYVIPNNGGFDMRYRNPLLLSEREQKISYNAWWFMCMPVKLVEEYGLPLPMFIKCDDVEYGMRCCKKIMTINGLGVWHENFDKKYSGELEYYIKRNEMILNAVYRSDLGAIFHLKKLIRAAGKQLVYQRYYSLRFLFKAYEDFLKGPDYFFKIDAEKLHLDIRAQLPQYYTEAELKNKGYKTDNIYRGSRTRHSFFKQIITLNGYLIPTAFYNQKEVKYGRVIDMITAKPKDFYKSKVTVQYNTDNKKGFITIQKRLELINTFFNLLKISFKMLRYRKTALKYKEAVENLKSK